MKHAQELKHIKIFKTSVSKYYLSRQNLFLKCYSNFLIDVICLEFGKGLYAPELA